MWWRTTGFLTLIGGGWRLASKRPLSTPIPMQVNENYFTNADFTNMVSNNKVSNNKVSTNVVSANVVSAQGRILSEKYWYYFRCPKNVLCSILSFVFWIFPPFCWIYHLQKSQLKKLAFVFFQCNSETAFCIKTISFANKVKHCHYLAHFGELICFKSCLNFKISFSG